MWLKFHVLSVLSLSHSSDKLLREPFFGMAFLFCIRIVCRFAVIKLNCI